MAIHYNNALHPEQITIPACKPNAGHLKATTDIGRVSCKNCLLRLGLLPKAGKS
jgi:transcription elongation factor Elf1